MKSIYRHILGIFGAAFLLMLPLAPALACTNPAGVAGDSMFNETENLPQYCDGTNWIAMIGADPKSCPSGLSSCGGQTDERVIFTTSTIQTGIGLGGLTGADAICQGLADSAVFGESTRCSLVGVPACGGAREEHIRGGASWAASVGT